MFYFSMYLTLLNKTLMKKGKYIKRKRLNIKERFGILQTGHRLLRIGISILNLIFFSVLDHEVSREGS